MTAVAVAGGEGKRRAAGNGDAALGLIMVAPILVTMVALVFFPLGQMNDPAQSQVAGQVEAILVPTESGKTRSYGLPEALGIPKVSQNQDAAIAFVKWFTSKQFQMANYANGALPTRTSALAALNDAGKLRSGDVLVAESKVVEPLFAQGTPTWYPQFSSAVNTAINGAAKGQITVDQAMKNIADATQKAMAQ